MARRGARRADTIAGATSSPRRRRVEVRPATVSDLVVELELPPELSFVGLRASRGTTWSCDQTGAVVACAMTAGELAAGGDVALQLQTLVDVAAEPGEIETVIDAASAEIGDPERATIRPPWPQP